MITTILFVLVAVVVLIVIIAVLALHFLRADDSDTFDEMPAEPRSARRSAADPAREHTSAGTQRRRSRHPEPVAEPPARDPWTADRRVRATDNAPAGYRDRDTGLRQPVTERRSPQSTGPRPAAVGARTAKSARVPDPDAKTSSWDSLSDVDYWAELAADKPQVGPAASGSGSLRPNGTDRRGPEAKPAARTSNSRPVQRSDSGPLPVGPEPVPSLPVRPRSQSSRPAAGASAGRAAEAGQMEQPDVRAARAASLGTEPATQSLAALARLSGPQPAKAPRPAAGPRPGSSQRPGSGQRPGPGQRPAQPPPSSVPAAYPSQPIGYPRTPVPLDDDPLTSPSFPAINTSDSRSYRARSSSGAHTGPHIRPQAGPPPASGRSSGRFAEPTAQYPVPQAPAAQAPITQVPVPPASGSQLPPVANPYGSYVSAPQPAYQDAAAARQDVPSYGGGYSNGQQADGSWYGSDASGYVPTPGYTGGDQAPNGNGYNGNGYNGNGYGYNGNDQNGALPGASDYGPVDYQNLTYQSADYQPAPPVPGGYGQQNHYQYEQRGYGVPDLAYGQDGYQGYTGYGTGGR